VLPGANVAAGARVGPHVVVGSGSRVGADSSLADTSLGSRTVVGEGVAATGLLTGPDVRLGRGLEVLGDTVLGEAVTVDHPPQLPIGTRVPPPRD
jgi:NDP-sugar pyrophosphorylase family protein